MAEENIFAELGNEIAKQYDTKLAEGEDPEKAATKIVLIEYRKTLKGLMAFKKKNGLSLADNKKELKDVNKKLKNL